MRAIDQLRAAVSMQPQRRSVKLPDGSELEFYTTPLTMAQRARATKQSKDDDPTDFALQLLAMKATDESGQKLFAAGELAELRNDIPASVADALIIELLDDAEKEDEEEAEDPKPSRRSSRSKET